MDAKTTSIVAYLSLVGWLIAFLAGDKESSLSKQHINQALICVIADCIPGVCVVGWVFSIMGIVRAIKEDETPLPLIGTIKIIK